MLARPLHPVLIHPRTGLRLQAVGLRADGRPIWPVMGGNGEGEGEGEGGGQPPAGGPAGGGNENDKGYPDGTPVAEMTAEQQIAYWKHHSRKHEATANARGDYDEVKKKADAHDAAMAAARTDEEKRIAEAIEQGRAEARAAAAPKLLASEFKANAAGRQVNGQPLNADAIVAGLDAAKFLDAAGDVDAAKVVAYLDGIAPVAKVATGPSAHGSGGRPSGAALTGKELGAAEAARRFPQKTTTTLTPSR